MRTKTARDMRTTLSDLEKIKDANERLADKLEKGDKVERRLFLEYKKAAIEFAVKPTRTPAKKLMAAYKAMGIEV